MAVAVLKLKYTDADNKFAIAVTEKGNTVLIVGTKVVPLQEVSKLLRVTGNAVTQVEAIDK